MRRLWHEMLVVKRDLQRPSDTAHRVLTTTKKSLGSEYDLMVRSRFERFPGLPELVDVPLAGAKHALAIAQIDRLHCRPQR